MTIWKSPIRPFPHFFNDGRPDESELEKRLSMAERDGGVDEEETRAPVRRVEAKSGIQIL